MSNSTVIESNNQTVIEGDNATIIESSSTQIENNSNLSNTRKMLLKKFMGYEVDEEFDAKGGEADIYRIIKDSERYVLKLYRKGRVPKEDVLRKIKEISETYNDYFIRTIEFGMDNETGRYYEILEEAEHGNICEYLKSRDCADKDIMSIINTTIEGLKILHDREVLHLDLKPENILVKKGTPLKTVLSDFGISSTLKEEFTKKMTEIKGTSIYMSPEARSGVVRKESDYWSVGIVIMYLKLGKLPFDGIEKKLSDYYMNTSGIEIPEELPPKYRHILKGLLHRKPEKRWGYEEIKLWLSGRNDIQVYDDSNLFNSDKNRYGKEFKYTDKAGSVRSYVSIETYIREHISNEADWEMMITHMMRGNLSAWAMNNGDNDTATKIDDIKENSVDKEKALIKLIYSFIEENEFIYKGKIINIDNLIIFLGKILKNESNSIEIEIIDRLLNGNILELMNEYWSISGKNERMIKMLDSLVQYSKKLSINTKTKNFRTLLIFINEKEKYFIPKAIRRNELCDGILSSRFIENIKVDEAMQYVMPINLKEVLNNNKVYFDVSVFLLDNFEKLIKKEAFSKFKNDYVVPKEIIDYDNLEFYAWREATVTIFNNKNNFILIEEYDNIKNKYFIPQKIKELKDLEDLTSYLEQVKFLSNNLNKFILKKEIENSLLPIEVKNIEKLTNEKYIELLTKLEPLKQSDGIYKFMNCQEYESYLKDYILPKEVKKLKSYGIDKYLRVVKWMRDKSRKYIVKAEMNDITEKYIVPLEYNYLDELMIADYEKAELVKESLITKSEYESYLKDYIMPQEVKELKSYGIDKYLKVVIWMTNKNRKYIATEEMRELTEKYIVPIEYRDISKLTIDNYEEAESAKESLITKSEYNELVSKYLLPDEVINMQNSNVKGYLEGIEIINKYRSKFIDRNEIERLSKTYVIPEEILRYITTNNR